MDILTKDIVKMRSLCETNHSLDNWEMAFEDIAWRYGHSSNVMYEVFKLLLEEGKIPTIYQKPLLFQIYINYSVDKSFVTTLKRILKTEQEFSISQVYLQKNLIKILILQYFEEFIKIHIEVKLLDEASTCQKL